MSALANNAALHLGKRSDDVKKHLTGSGRRIETLRFRDSKNRLPRPETIPPETATIPGKLSVPVSPGNGHTYAHGFAVLPMLPWPGIE
jgi:hypothetical protein